MHARVVVGWDVLKNPSEKAYLDGWLAGAKTAKVRPLVSFNHSRIPGQEAKLPSVAAFKREVRAFRKAYPQVKDFVTWNEGNHISQPTFSKPARAAQYYDVLAAACRGCRIAAADVLDDRQPRAVAAHVRAQGQAQGQDLGPAQLRRRERVQERRHEADAARRQGPHLVHQRPAAW